MPDISVIIPVYRENGIARSVERLVDSAGDAVIEVIVVDGTPDGSSLKLFERGEVLKLSSSRGRAIQMNAGAAKATAPMLLFLHADTALPDGWAQSILDAQDRGYSAGAFLLGIDAPALMFRIIEAGAKIRCRLTRIPYGDQAIFISKKLFGRVKGYGDLPFLEDVEIMQRLRRQGVVITIVDKKVLTSARRWFRNGIICHTLRNRLIMAIYTLGGSPSALQRFYR